MKPEKLSRNCLSFRLLLMVLSALATPINAQDNETETATKAISARTIEIGEKCSKLRGERSGRRSDAEAK